VAVPEAASAAVAASHLSDDLAIATFLALESTRGVESTWWPWLHSLRDPFLRSRLAYWDDAHLALLCDDQLVARVRSDRAMVDSLWRSVADAYLGAGPGDGAGGGAGHGARAAVCPVDPMSLLDMVELVRSRTFLNGFALPSVVLVPFADM
jgi:hypothetical protein